MDTRILHGIERDVEDVANNIAADRFPGGPLDRLVEISRRLIAEIYDYKQTVEELKEEIWDLEDETGGLEDEVWDLEENAEDV